MVPAHRHGTGGVRFAAEMCRLRVSRFPEATGSNAEAPQYNSYQRTLDTEEFSRTGSERQTCPVVPVPPLCRLRDS